MEKLSEYIPFLIIIVSVIISLVGKAKRQLKDATLPKEVFPVPQQPLIPEEFEQPVFPQKIAPQVVPQTPVSDKKQHAVYKKPVEIQENNEYEGIGIDFSEPDEMKKAIIYSEIFNRKNFYPYCL